MDLLSDILATIRIRGTLYFHTAFTPPWGIRVPIHGRAARFHIVVQGHCHAGLDGGASHDLRAGDMVLFPRGAAHLLTDIATREVVALDQVLADSGFSGEGALVVGGPATDAPTQMTCGHLSFADGADHPLLRALPDEIVIRRETRDRHRWLDDTITALSREPEFGAAGAAATVNRLAEILFIEIVRAATETVPSLSRVMAAISDPRVGRALSAIHHDPAHDWTLDTLAGEAALSRSRFAERFRDLVGLAPAAYLSEWRMQKARALLVDTPDAVGAIAARVGYRSPSAFARAFADAFGASPSAFRGASQSV